MRSYDARAPLQERVQTLAHEMQHWGLLKDPAPPAALRWIETFLEAYGGELTTYEDARTRIAVLRAEATMIPALDLERLRTREVLFFLDSVAQYVDAQPELRGLPIDHDLAAIAQEFGLSAEDAVAAVRMALTGEKTGPSLEFIFPLLGHDRVLIRIGAVSSKLLHGRGLEPLAFGPDGKPFEPMRGRRPSDVESGD